MASALDRARDILLHGADLVDLAEAIGTIIRDPSSSLDDIRLGLRYGGLIAEQAELELRRRQAFADSAGRSGAVVLPSEGSRSKPPAGMRE